MDHHRRQYSNYQDRSRNLAQACPRIVGVIYKVSPARRTMNLMAT